MNSTTETGAMVVVVDSAEPVLLDAPPSSDSARAYAAAGRSSETRRAYSREWLSFVSWCQRERTSSCPASPDTVAVYIASLADAGRKAAGIDLALAAISSAHAAAGHDGRALRGSAPVRLVRAGIRRTIGTAQRQAAPATIEIVRTMTEPTAAQGLAAVRDRALLLVGFSGAFRRSELVALTVADLTFSERGVAVTIRRSKTDQEGKGRTVALPAKASDDCPVRALRAWLDLAGITTGSIFRSVDRWGTLGGALGVVEVGRTVKRYAAAMGLDPALFSGHSLRAGLATSAANAGKSDRAIMAQTGHRSRVMVDRYVRNAEMWRDNAATGL